MITFRVFIVTSILIDNLCLKALEYNLTEYDRLSLSLGPCFLDVGDPCNAGRIVFYLYNSASGEHAVNLTIHDKKLPPEYKQTAKTKILIHGYAGSADFYGIVKVRRAYQQKGNFNVIVVDWEQLVKLPCYPIAVINTIQAGKCTALLLANIASLQGEEVSEFHAIGFSLGAHVAGFTSNELQRMQGRKLGRITGLDPALPFFASLSESWKLDKRDAHFVDIIHTNVGIFGKIEATGHADFYVNKGTHQPGCKNANNEPLCSHIMSLTYYAESITARDDKGFWGLPCFDYILHIVGICNEHAEHFKQALMGENCKITTNGIYFVPTRSHAPYALGKIP